MVSKLSYMGYALRRIALKTAVSSCLGLFFFFYLQYSESLTGTIQPIEKTISGILLSIVIANCAGFAAGFLNQWLDRLFPWQSGFAGRFLLGYIAQVIGLSLVAGGISVLLIESFGPAIFWRGLSITDEDLAWKFFILIVVVVFIYKVIYTILYSYRQYAVTQIETVQNERKQLELQFEALKSQLSPHYLFNSLNTISSLIYNDPQTAEQFIRRLALTYQYILSTQQKKYVTLSEELDFVQSYYYLLRIRFQQSLTLEVNLPKSILTSPIPPLTLQLLVENAVKHNTITPEKPLLIYISAVDNTQLRVTNTKNESVQSSASFRIGIENIRKRYEFFTAKKVEVKDDEKFIVSLPVLRLRETTLQKSIA
ncbi:MAG: histidine kinase [Cyclobacteriaceae bacterium]